MRRSGGEEVINETLSNMKLNFPGVFFFVFLYIICFIIYYNAVLFLIKYFYGLPVRIHHLEIKRQIASELGLPSSIRERDTKPYYAESYPKP